VSLEVNIMRVELVGEFNGKNTGWRVLSDEKIETTAQGRGNILGIDALLVSTSVGTMRNGIFIGEVNSVFTTMDGETIMSKGIAVGYPLGNGEATRATSIHTTLSQKLARLNKVVGIHEYETDMNDIWTGKIWEWK
jgi:hypothetical protein